MTITITYRVDQNLYHAANTKHEVSLITSEYTHGTDLLVRLQIGKNLGIRLNDRLGDLLPDGIPKEQFLFKKTYNDGDAKLITRSTFDAKLSRFDMSRTAIEREILEDYRYTDKHGLPGHVQIVMTDNSDTTVATIDFENAGQYESFPCPDWLAENLSI